MPSSHGPAFSTKVKSPRPSFTELVLPLWIADSLRDCAQTGTGELPLASQRLSNWLIRSKNHSNKNIHKEDGGRRGKGRPTLELLEDRTVLTATLNISAQGVATFTGSAVSNNLSLSLA